MRSYPAEVAAIFVFFSTFWLYMFKFFAEVSSGLLGKVPRWIRQRFRYFPHFLATVFGVYFAYAYAGISLDSTASLFLIQISVALSMASVVLMASGVEFMKMVPSERDSGHLISEWIIPPHVPDLNRAALGFALIFSGFCLVAGFIAMPLSAVETESLEVGGQDYGQVELLLMLNEGYLLRGGDWCDGCIWFLSKDGNIRVR